MRSILKKILRILAKRMILRYHPIVIGITGSVGKTTAKEAIYAVLERRFRVRKNRENYNNEIGIPLTVLGVEPLGSRKARAGITAKIGFVWSLIDAAWHAYVSIRKDYPDVLILELGADHPGDISYLVDIVHPQIGVITAIGDTPVHVEFYPSPQAVAQEKSQLIRRLPSHDGLALLNADDAVVLKLRENTEAHITTFGFSETAVVRASDVSFSLQDDIISGLSFKLHRGSSFVPVHIPHLLGAHQLYGVLAAAAVGIHFGMNLIEISEAFERIEFPRGRMAVIPGRNHTTLIDDTYNASPMAVEAALNVLKDFGRNVIALHGGKGRCVAILGDMRELGDFELSAHQNVGHHAASRVDFLITVGDASKETAKAAKEKMPPDRVVHFDRLDEALKHIFDHIKENDIILIKGSQSSRMEKIVKALMAEPEKAGRLLIRQSPQWLAR